MRKATIGLVLILMTAVLPASADEEVYNFLKMGYSFFEGDVFGAVGRLEPLQTQNPPIIFDFDSYEVTWALLDVVVVDETPVGPFIEYTLADGSIGIYEDPGFDLDWGNSPADGIATATNGTPALLGEFYTGTFLFNTVNLTGSFLGTFTFTDGSRIAELGGLANIPWSIYCAASGDDYAEVPPGYHSKFAGRMFVGVTPAEDSNWSDIKALY